MEKTYLENKIIVVKPVPESFNTEFSRLNKEHVAKFRLPHCSATIMLRLDEQTRGLKQILTSDEQAWFEVQLGMKPGDLSFFRTGNNPNDPNTYNYWYGFQVKLTSEEELRLNLANLIDNLRYRVLLVDREVAPSWELRTDRPSYKWALVDESYVIKSNTEKADLKVEAFMKYSGIKDSKQKLIDVLKVLGRVYTFDTDISVLQNDLYRIIETPSHVTGLTIKDFLKAVQDKDTKTKVFITDAVRISEIKQVKSKYILKSGDTVANSLNEMIEYADDAENQEWRKLVEEKIKSN